MPAIETILPIVSALIAPILVGWVMWKLAHVDKRDAAKDDTSRAKIEADTRRTELQLDMANKSQEQVWERFNVALNRIEELNQRYGVRMEENAKTFDELGRVRAELAKSQAEMEVLRQQYAILLARVTTSNQQEVEAEFRLKHAKQEYDAQIVGLQAQIAELQAQMDARKRGNGETG